MSCSVSSSELALSAFNDVTGNSGSNRWSIGRATIDLSTMRLISPSVAPIIEATHLGPDFDFVADPFRLTVDSTAVVFAEAWSRSAQRGQIAAFLLDAEARVVKSAVVLAEPFHLSYPCVFRSGGSYYMLPEAWESGQLSLYKARTFPWEWEHCKVLVELDYADPQILFHENVWYIFLNTDPLTNACASIFWAESLRGSWHPHAVNPALGGDVRLARSAGPLLRHDGRIIRFSQDCRSRYGQGVFASEIIELSPSRFHAATVGPVGLDRPSWARSAFHHLDVYVERGVHHALFDGYSAADPQPQ